MENDQNTSDAFLWAYREFIGNDPERIASYEEERIKAAIAQQAYDLRRDAGLTQSELADLMGTTESVIDDIEESDYEGDALAVLVRIAAALRRRINVRFTAETVDMDGGPSAHTWG